MESNVHTVKILDLIMSDSMEHIFIVMNHMDSDLNRYFFSQKVRWALTEEITILLTFKLLCALNFLHSANVIHRDIKLQNILVDENLDIQFCDFGLARTLAKPETRKKDYDRIKMATKLKEMHPYLKNKKRELSRHVVTRSYRPPEIILEEKKYGSAVDNWSMGCVIS